MEDNRVDGVELLLVSDTDEKVQMQYADNPYTWSMSLIGPRPPYFCHPRVEAHYPLI
ncbi:hypothetical protein [Sutcliffiella rhizosphaerae]|uniref:Uncharacterized protein n=1 Tax=Sutcliffiella rhizosphaerae TaxID=2880967 RepID=A0ABN8ADE0_9BACI|nr:hypothetical protein [Sutcliffiella rhizosphaerae]CAG9623263.1 hypothetical protein BACCIP111883_04059 [Sutcliffiella rhizosphaerae]